MRACTVFSGASVAVGYELDIVRSEQSALHCGADVGTLVPAFRGDVTGEGSCVHELFTSQIEPSFKSLLGNKHPVALRFLLAVVVLEGNLDCVVDSISVRLRCWYCYKWPERWAKSPSDMFAR